MTIGSSLGRVVSTGNGSTTEYPFNAPVAADTEIKVYTLVIATGVQTLQTKGGSGTYDYTVSINSSTKYATITLGTALPDTHKVILLRNVPMTQDTDYVEGDAFGADTHEAALDKLTTISTQVSEVQDRCIKVQESSATSDIVCEELVADKILGVNAAGDGIEMKSNVTTNATSIELADESSDSTCFPVFVTAATGTLEPKTGSNLSFNSSTGALTATSFSGTVATATVATTVTITDNENTNEDNALIFTAGGDVDGGNIGLESDGTCTYNPSTGKITATGFIGTLAGAVTGNVTGNASGSSGSCTGTAAIATAVTVADESSDTTCFPLFATGATGDLEPKSGSNLSFNSATGALTATSFVGTAPTPTAITVADESSDTTCFPLFVTAATGDLGPKSAAGLTFNSSTDVLSGTFAGNITGNVTGNTSGTSGSTTGNAATATILATARDIGGVSFNGSASINLPGVNTAGNQNTSGTAAGLSATLATGSGGTGLTGAVVGKQTIWVPAAAMYPNTTAGCSALAQVELSNGPEIKVLDFDPSTDEHAQFTVAFPKLWNLGTVTFQAFFTVAATNTGTVAWGLSAVAFADNDEQNTAFGTNVVATAKAHSGTSNDLNVCAESGAVTIAGSPGDNELVYFQIMRDISADDQSGDARLLGIKLFFTTDALTDA